MYRSANVTVLVEDLDRAIRFYRDKLGLGLVYRSGDQWATLQAPGVTIGLHSEGTPPPDDADRGKGVTLGFEVEDLEAAVAALRNKGVVFSDRVDDDYVRLAYFQDPDGTTLYLSQVERVA